MSSEIKKYAVTIFVVKINLAQEVTACTIRVENNQIKRIRKK